MLRPVVIALVVMTHIPAALYRPDLKDVALGLGTFASAWISGVIALAALPTLSVISGYLAFFSLKRYRYIRFVGNKFRRLVIPMLLWGLVWALLIYYRQASGIPYRTDLNLYPLNVEGWARALTAIGKIPANAPLFFLRELFLSTLLIPLWLLVARSRIASLLLAGAIFYCSLAGISFGFFLRIDIYLYFFIGVFLARNPDIAALGQSLRPHTGMVAVALLVFSAALTLYSFSEDARHFPTLIQIFRLFGPLAFWLIGAWLVKSPLRRPLLTLEPASYTVFLGHGPCVTLLWESWTRWLGYSVYTWSYLLATITLFTVTFALLWSLWRVYSAVRRRMNLSGPRKTDAVSGV